MGWFNLGRKGGNKKTASTISRMLDDLTHLEINTIIKKGMTAAPQPDSIEETLQILFNGYKERMAIILLENDIDPGTDFDFSLCKTIYSFHNLLLAFRKHMDDHQIRLVEFDYIRVLRMISFCEYIYSKSKGEQNPDDRTDVVKVKPYIDGISDSLYDLDLSDITVFRLVMDARDRVKIKRLFDLGTENVVMQTRFGLDGDVVTRIEEGFASKPRQLVIDIHDKHTNLSVQYWKNRIGLVQDIVSKLLN
jgi:hypothetical protein